MEKLKPEGLENLMIKKKKSELMKRTSRMNHKKRSLPNLRVRRGNLSNRFSRKYHKKKIMSEIKIKDSVLKGFISSRLGVKVKKKKDYQKKKSFLLTEPGLKKFLETTKIHDNKNVEFEKGKIPFKNNIKGGDFSTNFTVKSNKKLSRSFRERSLPALEMKKSPLRKEIMFKKPFFKKLKKKGKSPFKKKKKKQKDPRVLKMLSLIAKSHLPKKKPDEIEKLFMADGKENPFKVEKNALKDSVALFMLSIEANKTNFKLENIDIFKPKKSKNYFINTDNIDDEVIKKDKAINIAKVKGMRRQKTYMDACEQILNLENML